MKKFNEMTPKIQYSVVVPVYNEEGNISLLDAELKKVMNKISKSYEVIYINDGSTDKTLGDLRKLKNVVIINLNRNYGQATALDAGFKTAKGDIVISMDGDMQNDPNDIPKMILKLHKDKLDVVCGWRTKRKDKAGIQILTKVGKFVRRRFVKEDVSDTGCTLRVYKRGVVRTLDIGGEMHRYIVALLRWKGFKIGEIKVNHRARVNGKTKYGYSKAIRGFVDLIYMWFIEKYYQRPLHIFGAAGLFIGFVGFMIELFTVYQRIFNGMDLSDSAWMILGFFLMFTGAMLFICGIMFDMIIKIYLNTSKHEKRYYIRKIWRTVESPR